MDTTIKVDAATRDRIAALASDEGVTIREMTARLASATPTRAELHARAAQARAYVRAHLCPDLSDDDVAAGQRFWEQLRAGDVPASLDDTRQHSAR